MSAAISTGYANSPWDAAKPRAVLSLNEWHRSKSPMGVTVLKIHVSSVTEGTSDWRKNTEREGSSPQARKSTANSRTFARSASAF